MRFLTVIMFIFVIALALIPVCLHTGILIKDLGAKRHWIVLSALMILAILFSRIIEAKPGLRHGLVSGQRFCCSVLPVIYIDYLKKGIVLAIKVSGRKPRLARPAG